MTTVSDSSVPVVASSVGPPPRKLRAARRRRTTVFRWITVVIVGGFFLIPLYSLFESSTKNLGGRRVWDAWQAVGSLATADDPNSKLLWVGLRNSLFLVALTLIIMLVLLVPTMTWIRLRVPWMRRTMEFVCLLALTIPAIVLVVGLAPIYRQISHILSTDTIWLCFAYAVLVLPFAYRSLDAGLDAIDVKTLSEAARSLGSSWTGVILRIVIPNIRSAVVSACFISLALVLGEFTFASLLNRQNFATAIFQVGQDDGRLAMALSLVSLLVAFVLLLVLSLFSHSRKGRKGKTA
ncbi:ABC transporter permease subunit [Nakamurella silvestris]|nr:ABC transporter permease subunit [Nakamurella silvestris]